MKAFIESVRTAIKQKNWYAAFFSISSSSSGSYEAVGSKSATFPTNPHTPHVVAVSFSQTTRPPSTDSASGTTHTATVSRSVSPHFGQRSVGAGGRLFFCSSCSFGGRLFRTRTIKDPTMPDVVRHAPIFPAITRVPILISTTAPRLRNTLLNNQVK
jgi:hypothetical protein